MRNLFLLIAIALSCSCRPAWSNGLFDLGEWYFKHFDKLEEHSVDVITTIIQDEQGFIWLGSQNGLLRYDGYDFKAFLPDIDDPNSISGKYIQAILEVDNKIWVGTYSDGLSIYDPFTQTFSHYRKDEQDPLSLADDDVRALARVRDYVFLGSKSGVNLFTRNGRSLGIIQITGCAQVMSEGRINTLLYDEQFFWIGTANGLCRLSVPAQIDAGQTWQGIEVADFAGQRVFHLAVDNLRQIWVGTTNHGAAVIQPGSFSVTKIPYDPKDPTKLNAPWVDEFVLVEDEMWLATAGAGIAIIDTRTLNIVRHLKRQEGVPNTLSSNDISSFLKDKSGLIWIGSWGGGLNRFSPANRAFRSLRSSFIKTNSLSHPDIRAMKELQNGHIWFGSFVNGIDVVDPDYGVIRGFRPDPEDPLALQGGYIFCIEQMPDGEIWVSTLDHGFFKYLPDKDGFKQFVDLPNLADNTVRTLKAEGNDWLWIGTDAGISLLNTITDELYRIELFDGRTPYFDRVVEAIVIYDGYAWVGTNQGLFIADKVSRKLVPVVSPKNQSLADNFITDIHIATNGDMYLANSLGFDRLKSWDPSGLERGQVSAQFESISSKVGMRGRHLGSTILEDDMGRLWVQNRVLEQSQQTNADSPSASDDSPSASVDYPSASGNWHLTTINKSSGWDVGNLWIGSNEKLSDGTLLFGGTLGVLVVQPELYEKWTYEPDVVTTRIARDSISVPPADSSPLIVQPNSESFFIEFSSLDFSDPDKIQYQYKMDGYDSNWINTDARNRRASYSRLQPGDYVLKVRATNREGVWSSKELNIKVTQLPAWYETWWLRSLGFLVFSLLLFSFYKYRVAALSRQKRELDSIVAARTADLELLGKIGKDITSSLELDDVMNSVYQHVSKLIDTDVFLMGSCDYAQKLIRVRFLKEKNKPREQIDYSLAESNRPAVWCVLNQKTLITNNRLELLEYVEEIKPPKFGDAMESIIYVPLQINDKVVGCLSLQSQKQNAYTANDVEMLQNVVAYAAIALTNAESHNKLESALGEIERISLTDQLTGAKNRRFLENLMPVEMARIKRARSDNSPLELGFVLIDIDHFKSVNDSWGHDAGDQLLIQFVQLLIKICRESDWVVRLGGEEFVIVAQIENQMQLTLLAERIRKAVQDMAFKLAPDLILEKTCSLGLVTVPFVNGDFSKISWQKCLNIADHAMYAAKENGRNAWVAIFANQAEVESNLYEVVLQDPDSLRKSGKIDCPSSFPEEKQWRFNSDKPN